MKTICKTRRRRGGRHYKTGIYRSSKCPTPIKYRSGWELVVVRFLDHNPDVLSYEYESLRIHYVYRGKVHCYFPDLVVRFKSKPQPMIIEVKRQDKIADPKVMAKTKAAKEWALKNNHTFQMWTNKMIEVLEQVLLLEEMKTAKKCQASQPQPP